MSGQPQADDAPPAVEFEQVSLAFDESLTEVHGVTLHRVTSRCAPAGQRHQDRPTLFRKCLQTSDRRSRASATVFGDAPTKSHLGRQGAAVAAEHDDVVSAVNEGVRGHGEVIDRHHEPAEHTLANGLRSNIGIAIRKICWRVSNPVEDYCVFPTKDEATGRFAALIMWVREAVNSPLHLGTDGSSKPSGFIPLSMV
ncbi:MAG: hypothetical protein AB7H93_06865 [Vicinamibacterales bacterium]